MAKRIKLTQTELEQLKLLLNPVDKKEEEEVELEIETDEVEIKTPSSLPEEKSNEDIESLKDKITSLEADLKNEKDQNTKWRELFNEKEKEDTPRIPSRKGW